MAAYASLLSLEQTIHHYHDTYSLSPQEEQQIMSMSKNVTLLKEFLECSPNKADNILEEQMRDLSNHVENIFEYFTSETITFRFGSIIKWMFRKSKFEFELDKLAKEMESFAAEVLQRIKEERVDVDYDHSRAAVNSSSSRLADMHKKDAMIGFDDDLLAIKERLCGESYNLQIVRLLEWEVSIRAWVTVSQDYSTDKVLSDLVASIKELNAERSGQVNELNVYQTLKGRRYLNVMDDIWTTKAWDDVKRIFPDDGNGSRIMLTTRLSDVAAYADSSSPVHQMRLMDMDRSWDMLYRKVFAHDEHCTFELESIGKEIARNCGGLPLALSVIGGLLSTVRKNPASWMKISNNVKSAINATKDGHIEKVLSLSYTHLPHHLRPCFLYMGAFPEDYEIRASKLIKLWVAEGFLKKSSGSKSYEEVAEIYLEDLVKRSLVLVTKRKSYGRKIKSCSMHDLVRDLCIKKAQQEKFLAHNDMNRGDVEFHKNQSRVSIDCYDLNALPNVYGSDIRTIICFRSIATSLVSLGELRLLRVLDTVKSSSLPSLPLELFRLFHLRYLSLDYAVSIPPDHLSHPSLYLSRFHNAVMSHFDVPHHPVSVFQNLRTLIILSSSHLPLNIWEMPLSGVRNLICTDWILHTIPSLKKMKIFYDEDVYGRDLDLHNLVLLRQLENLELKMYGVYYYHMKFNPAFPTSLQKLTLSSCRIPWKDMTIVGSLPNLRVLKLRDSNFEDGKSWKTDDGEFEQLEFLLIEKSQLEEWVTESSHFPRLNCLLLHYCQCLSEIPDGIGEIPTLELIEVKGYNEDLVKSAKRIQEEQQDCGNDSLQVRCFDF